MISMAVCPCRSFPQQEFNREMSCSGLSLLIILLIAYVALSSKSYPSKDIIDGFYPPPGQFLKVSLRYCMRLISSRRGKQLVSASHLRQRSNFRIYRNSMLGLLWKSEQTTVQVSILSNGRSLRMEETMAYDLLRSYWVRMLYFFLLELTTMKMFMKSSFVQFQGWLIISVANFLARWLTLASYCYTYGLILMKGSQMTLFLYLRNLRRLLMWSGVSSLKLARVFLVKTSWQMFAGTLLKVLCIWNRVGRYSLNYVMSVIWLIFLWIYLVRADHCSWRVISSLSRKRQGHLMGLFLPYFSCIFLTSLSQFCIIFFWILSLLWQQQLILSISTEQCLCVNSSHLSQCNLNRSTGRQFSLISCVRSSAFNSSSQSSPRRGLSLAICFTLISICCQSCMRTSGQKRSSMISFRWWFWLFFRSSCFLIYTNLVQQEMFMVCCSSLSRLEEMGRFLRAILRRLMRSFWRLRKKQVKVVNSCIGTINQL